MLELNKIEFYGASKTREPRPDPEMDAELKRLWPKIAALNAGEMLVVPYDSAGKVWAGYSYCRKLRKLFASYQPAKFCNLKVKREKNKLYILAVRDIWQPAEESQLGGMVVLLGYLGILCGALMHWNIVAWTGGFLLLGFVFWREGWHMRLLREQVEKIEQRLEDLEARTRSEQSGSDS